MPFFVLDELTASKCQDEEGEKYAAFQRNVFRACGLVVLVMGTDAKITKLTHQLGGSSGDPHMWMTVFSRFPPYQPIRFEDEAKQDAWDRIRAHYPVLMTIVEHSRGRFVRHFVDRAAVYAMEKSHTFDLRDLLDDAFCYVRTRVEETKRFMSKPEGRNAQMMAMSNVDAVETSEPETKRRRIASGIQSMHSHFANLADSQHTDVYVSQGELTANGKEWLPLCSFPTIREDVLLYLAVLGGKTYSGYYNESVWRVFSLWKKRHGLTMGETTKAVSQNYKYYENMVAHMIFCASRRNGVRGILFPDFFPWLLGEFREQVTVPTKLVMGQREMAFSELLDGYHELAELPGKTVPFLAPPNAEWPPYILGAGCGCFGHLNRLENEGRSNISVRENVSPYAPLLICECKHWFENIDARMVEGIIDGLETTQKDKWKIVFVFCDGVANFRTQSWSHASVGCVRIACRSGHVEWFFQPVKGERKKIVVVMVTGLVDLKRGRSRAN
ncbi:hypothetical protein GN244_ATG07024 [Phytophthora infestans]|uniref:Crinkler (CRN) family protein n=1 Tax=Phytophthora infestans TaxID=4787 RepID=A0A833T791_PHYIN|nr:hypothetical protein GN244_ATG07024 [Phytophthora infestans]